MNSPRTYNTTQYMGDIHENLETKHLPALMIEINSQTCMSTKMSAKMTVAVNNTEIEYAVIIKE